MTGYVYQNRVRKQIYKRKHPKDAPPVPSYLSYDVISFIEDMWHHHGNCGEPPRWFIEEVCWEEEGYIKRKWTDHLD